MKYKVIKKDIEVERIVENGQGEQVSEAVIEEQDYVQETIIIEHKKSELIARLQQARADDDAEISRRQAHKAEVEAELEILTTPKVK